MGAQTLNVSSVLASHIRAEFSPLHSKLKQTRVRVSLPSPRLQPKLILCSSPNPPSTQPKGKKHSPSSSNKNRNNNKKKNNSNKSYGEPGDSISNSTSTSNSNSSLSQIPTPLPKPPAGFVVDDNGKLLSSSDDRLATLVDPSNNLPLKCVIRRVFTSSGGDQCMLLLCPLDMPVQILQSTGDGWLEVNYEELEPILPAAAYALAKLHMHLVYSGYCYTARGGFCYSEEQIFDFHEDGKEDGLPTEGVEITHFNLEGAHYMIYTPSDPLLFVAVKDQTGKLQIADDELLEDPAVISAIDEETEFNALVEEEAALFESLLDEQ